MADKNNENRSLRYLTELKDYKVASDHLDVRGWKVKDADGRTVGRVDDLIAHVTSERVVYVDVEVDPELIDVGHDPFEGDSEGGVREYINKDGDNHLIIPIGMVDIDKENKLVRCDGIDHTTFRNTKRYSKGNTLDRDYERTIYKSYVPEDGNTGQPTDDDTFYDRDEFQRRDSWGDRS